MKKNKTLVRLVAIVLVFTMIIPFLASCETTLFQQSAPKDRTAPAVFDEEETSGSVQDIEADGEWNPRPWNPEEDEDTGAATEDLDELTGDAQGLPPLPTLTEIVVMLDEAMLAAYGPAKAVAFERGEELSVETYVPLELGYAPLHVMETVWGVPSETALNVEGQEGMQEARWVLGLATIPELEGDHVQLCTIHAMYNERGYIEEAWAAGMIDPEPMLPDDTLYSIFEPGDTLTPLSTENGTD